MKLDFFGNNKDGYVAHGESTTEDLEACPFCGSRDVIVRNTHTLTYWGQCNTCRAEGPVYTSKGRPNMDNPERLKLQHRRAFKKGVRLWNTRLPATSKIKI